MQKNQNANDLKEKIKNDNRREALNDLEEQCCSNEFKISKINDHKNKPKIAKSNPYCVNNVVTSLLNKTIETFVERDKDDDEEELYEELETINHISYQVTNELLCQLHEDWID